MTAVDQAAGQVTDNALVVTDLLADGDALAARLAVALRSQQWLDAFLLAAGLSQLVEDRLHHDPLMLYRAASYLTGGPSRLARLAGGASGAAGAIARAGSSPRRRLRRARAALVRLTERLAGQVLTPEQEVPRAGLTAPLADLARALPALGGDVVRLPACYHSFDQHPDDVRWLVRALAQRYRLDGVPLCVVGVRTSGSYLAPLSAAALRAAGNPLVSVLTCRPGRPFLRWERAALRAVGRAGGIVLMTDDPPGSGTSLAAAAQMVAAAGVPAARIVFVLSLFGATAELPGPLAGRPAVVQPWPDWSVHARLAPGPVGRALAELAGPDLEVGEVQPLGRVGDGSDRGHVRALFAARLTDRRTGARVSKEILVEGAGLGYLGRHGVAVARALPGQLPRVYGFRDGLLYRDWLPPASVPEAGEALAATVAAYVDARRRALPAPSAAADRMGGRDPAWEVASRLLSGQFGPLSVPARPLLLDPLVRRLLGHDHPAVPDGKTDRRHWVPDPAVAGGLRKVDFYQRGFGHLDLACYDPVFDLAGAAADTAAPDFEQQLRDAYQRRSGQRVDPERWLLYRLAQLWRLGRAGDLGPDLVGQRSAAAIHDYLASWFLPGLAPGSGPVCAIDLDGVLECDRLGYPATSPTGMMALRALIAHGYRPVLATGRSLPEVRDRCAAFGLAGGVAEYGTVILRHDEATDLRPPPVADLLSRIRAELARLPGVDVDERYRYVVRARAGHGPVPAEVLAGIPALADPAIRVIHGDGQSDITAAGADKGTGLRALAGGLGAGCLLAVGDSPPDLPLFAEAALARAPRNARLPASGSKIRVTRHAYQAGLSDACADLLGHRPGRCARCRPPSFAPRTRAVLGALDLRSGGLPTIGSRAVAIAVVLARRSRW